MKLSFEQHMIPGQIAEELDFAGFLALFDLEVPMLPERVVKPLSGEVGRVHFAKLRQLQGLAAAGKLDPAALAARMAKLPTLDSVLPHFARGSLEQYHLFVLGRFLAEDRKMLPLEENLSRQQAACCAAIAKVLDSFMEPDCSGLRLSAEEREQRLLLEEADTEVAEGLTRYEAEIEARTGLAMIYPYPLELSAGAVTPRLADCELIAVTERGEICSVDYRLPPALAGKIAEREALAARFAERMAAKLALINDALAPSFADFRAWYEERREEVYRYALLRALDLHGLCLPEIPKEASGCRLSRAVLPCLRDLAGSYVPLDIDLRPGADLLFGGNMSGKTTVLKTLFFHLTLIRFGLPVPAAAARLHFPEQVDLHLKSSGDLRHNVSGFTEEIRFFCRPRRPQAYLLVDELFQSTDPGAGAALSAILLSEYVGSDAVFLCTSHYPEVLAQEGLHLFRMQNGDGGAGEHPSYEVEPLPAEGIGEALRESRRALQLALTFPLPDSVKEKIHRHLTRN